ncbi:MAG: DNA methyltransferase [Deltaproteobacteria bacterium]|nr:DNA methyltransferase [Deltaproteobacteria bacterium]
MNRLYYGDCLTVMQNMKSASVDLIYLDPPFNSDRTYNNIYKDETGRPLPDQIDAFCDMWELDEETERIVRTMPVLMRDAGVDDSAAELWKLWLNALRKTRPKLLAYLSYMTQRLLQMKVILKATGSIYLHCDPTAAHYIKIMMDSIFWHENFRSEIVWKRTSAHSGARRPGPVHDTILFYTKSDKYAWTGTYQDYDDLYVETFYPHKDPDGRRWSRADLTGAGVVQDGETGQPWRGINVSLKGRHWARKPADLDKLDAEGRIHWPAREGGMPRLKLYLDEQPGIPLQDVWTDIRPIHNLAAERMGYRTQKPVELLKRIIESSSKPDDVVFDPFCGCATTIEAAHLLKRQWVGIDIAIHAIKRVARIRLEDRLGLKEGTDFELDGVPRNLEGAQDLWDRDKYHFQKWAVEQIDGFVTSKRTADGGIDGRLYFGVPWRPELQSMVIEVKGGKNVSVESLRALRGVLDNDEALMAGLIIMEPLGSAKDRNFHRFMAEAGDLEVQGVEYPKMQILTVGEILDGKRFNTPGVARLRARQPTLPGSLG